MTHVDGGWRAYYEQKAGSFDELAATYESTVPLARMFYGARHDAVVGALPEGPCDRALDLGCGSGAYLPALAARAKHVTAVDLAHGYVAQAVARQGVGAGVQATATSLPFAAATFDVVLSTEVIEHLPQPTALLDEVHRVLKPGGTFVLTTPNPLAVHDLLYRVKRRVRGYDVDEHPGLMLPWTLSREIARRGYVEVRRATCNFLYPYPIGEVLGRLPNQHGIAAVSARFERGAQRAPVVRHLGWTHVRTLRKEQA